MIHNKVAGMAQAKAIPAYITQTWVLWCSLTKNKLAVKIQPTTNNNARNMVEVRQVLNSTGCDGVLLVELGTIGDDGRGVIGMVYFIARCV